MAFELYADMNFLHCIAKWITYFFTISSGVHHSLYQEFKHWNINLKLYWLWKIKYFFPSLCKFLWILENWVTYLIFFYCRVWVLKTDFNYCKVSDMHMRFVNTHACLCCSLSLLLLILASFLCYHLPNIPELRSSGVFQSIQVLWFFPWFFEAVYWKWQVTDRENTC